eukprot:CAMPEP_0118690132 /NCGR_PEP_ID=MMETSP0800-20121206/9909_1 /TAXON_ID=210618 ORGANISM="Striatella unipunctata, Strain CCMP2910" /NCGR_SAMPLE_ID=MMETSP0800 /ASSEMBLY_ACC=CAM_ASM_000638 /LENGTH=91 /DNA_ID=CAMNT_0006587675 /DNA_START=38 /DNA_END=313 /DNA_ORIENTATION=-
MAYIGADGTVIEKRSSWRFSIITDFIGEIFAFFFLLFGSVSRTKQNTLQNHRSTTYAERNRNPYRGQDGKKGSNVRGLKKLGAAAARAGGG